MSSGWLYVLELAPSGHIKVGKTAHPGRRLGQHASHAAFGGSAVVRHAAFATDDMDADEQRLLDRLGRTQFVSLVHGSETFSGLTFVKAVVLVDEMLTKPALPAATSTELMRRAAGAMDAAGVRRVLLGELRDLLGSEGPTTNEDLARQLRRNNVALGTVWSPVCRRTGYGVKRELLPA